MEQMDLEQMEDSQMDAQGDPVEDPINDLNDHIDDLNDSFNEMNFDPPLRPLKRSPSKNDVLCSYHVYRTETGTLYGSVFFIINGSEYIYVPSTINIPHIYCGYQSCDVEKCSGLTLTRGVYVRVITDKNREFAEYIAEQTGRDFIMREIFASMQKKKDEEDMNFTEMIKHNERRSTPNA